LISLRDFIDRRPKVKALAIESNHIDGSMIFISETGGETARGNQQSGREQGWKFECK
jgi:hypothetical protein